MISCVKDNQSSSCFATELLALKKNAESNLSIKDYQHLRKIIWVNRLLLVLGFGTAWISINLFSMICISLVLFSQWCIVTHHVTHGGYDKIVSSRSRYHSKNFAKGWRRLTDWLDWIYPESWVVEHNKLHHFNTNENIDPDFAEHRREFYIKREWPKWFRVCILCLEICTWKIIYYSLNTLKALHEKKKYDYKGPLTIYLRQAFLLNYIPYISIHFLLIPLLFFPLGKAAVFYVFINRLGAEVLTNIHSFLMIVPGHTGTPHQDSHFSNRAEFYSQQIANTYNFGPGGFWWNYLHGYLNYHIEHHLFPDLPPSQYVILYPKVKALCEKYNIQYKQESVFLRFKKTFRILTYMDGKGENFQASSKQ